MRCDDGGYYIVKFRNNPQHLRVLANEMLATRLAARLGLCVPQVEVVEVRPELIATPRNWRSSLAWAECHVPQANSLDRSSRATRLG